MKKNISTYIYFVLVMAIAIGCYFAFYQTKEINTDAIVAEKKAQQSFTKDNANTMKVDTFTMLINKAYGSLATVTTNKEFVKVSMTKANQVTKDFFNGNDALLQCNIKEHGFAIQYNASQKSLQADFAIANDGVTVPNDVLIKITDKIYNATKAKQ
jgi:hypothetical protein